MQTDCGLFFLCDSCVFHRESFRAYIAEDAFFLQTFSMGYAAAIERCVPGQTAPSSLSDEVISSVSHNLQDLHSGVMEELTMHETYAASWGIDISHHKSPAPATSRYCDFLKQIISSPQETVASILAAMIPCLRLYAYIGQSLFHAFYQDRKRQNPYSEWIRTYACPEYQRLPFLAEGMLDLLCGEESLGKLYFCLLSDSSETVQDGSARNTISGIFCWKRLIFLRFVSILSFFFFFAFGFMNTFIITFNRSGLFCRHFLIGLCACLLILLYGSSRADRKKILMIIFHSS